MEGVVLHWYVLRSKPRKEEWLCSQLAALQIHAYSPCYVEHSRSHSHKSKPYFPGYLFINVDIETTGISALQWIPGSIGLVSFGGDPAWVSDGMLQAIQSRVDQINAVGGNHLRGLKAGDEITIHSGPFAGYRGIFDCYLSDHERVMVFLKFIRNQQVHLELPVEQITATKQPQVLL